MPSEQAEPTFASALPDECIICHQGLNPEHATSRVEKKDHFIRLKESQYAYIRRVGFDYH